MMAPCSAAASQFVSCLTPLFWGSGNHIYIGGVKLYLWQSRESVNLGEKKINNLIVRRLKDFFQALRDFEGENNGWALAAR